MARICFLVDSLFSIGGVQRVTAVIADKLSQSDDVSIVSFDDPSSSDRSLYNLDRTAIHYIFFKYPHVPRFKSQLCRAYGAIYKLALPKWSWFTDLYALTSFPSERRHALERLLARQHFDVIIGVHIFLAARLVTMGARLRSDNPRLRLIGWCHNSFDALFAPSSKYAGSRLLPYFLRQFSRLDHYVVLTRQDRERYKQMMPKVSPIRISVIYNPLSLSPGNRSAGTSRQFLAVGRFTPLHKGFDLLIQAFTLFVSSDNQWWTLHIVGGGQEQRRYEQMIADNRLEDRIFLHPFTTNIQSYYSAAQIYVLSSRWEGLPLVLCEAMAHGLPIVSSDIPSCKEILGDDAIFFHNGDVRSLAEALTLAARLPWAEASNRALARVKLFDIDNITRQWRALWS